MTVTIHCILGKVSAAADGVVVDYSKAVPNSSKWIFDVEQTGGFGFLVQLLDFRKSTPKPPSILSPNAVPLNAEAAEAKIFFPEPNRLGIQVVAPAEGQGLLLYRVTVDALHSLMR